MSVSHTHTIERCLIYFVLLSDSVISEEFVKVKVNFIVNFFVCTYMVTHTKEESKVCFPLSHGEDSHDTPRTEVTASAQAQQIKTDVS